MQRVGIIGGETHIGEVTDLNGRELEIPVAAVRPDMVDWARETFGCDVVTSHEELLARDDLDIIAIANENDARGPVVTAALESGRAVIVDKPLCISAAEQDTIETLIGDDPKRLLMLLSLRGQPVWAGLRDIVKDGRIGTPAFTHVRMAVRLKRAQRPPWFLDKERSGGLFLDLLIHGMDQVEWLTGRTIVAVSANTGNLGDPGDARLVDHAAVYCELDDGSAAVVEGQRMLPDTKGNDYRTTVAGTLGYADLLLDGNHLHMTTPDAADVVVQTLPEAVSVVQDWLNGGDLVPQAASLRANRLALLATRSAQQAQRITL